MQDLLTSLLRQAVQHGVGVAALWLAAHGLNVPQSVTDWATLAGIAAGLWCWTAIIRALETRSDQTPLGKLARTLARLLMLGITTKPTYTPTPPAVAKAVRLP
jgi:hypothetical protein